MSDQWQDRIVGFERVAANQLQAHPYNARTHPAAQRESLRGSLDTLGWIAPVIINRRSNFCIDGHARIEEALTKNENMLLPVVYVDLADHEEAQALASYDFITTMADYSKDNLGLLLNLVETDDERVMGTMSRLAEDNDLYFGADGVSLDDSRYSREIEAPIYEPSREKPQISDLYDDSRTQELIEAIESSAHLDEQEREFLKVAARRHTVLNFSKIADFHAHSNPAVQKLMEDSALVIIDFDRAIELGFVKLTHQIADLERGIDD